MNRFNRLNFTQSSIMGRLLWPVNIIAFVLLLVLVGGMMLRAQTSIDSAMRSKAEGMSTFLQTVSPSYFTNYDLGALENFAKNVATDGDFSYVVYFDKDGHSITDSSRLSDDEKVAKVDRDILDAQGKPLGRVLIGYKRSRVEDAFWGTLKLGLLGLVLTQGLLSAAIFFVSRGIVFPLHESLTRLSKTTDVLSSTSSDVSKFSEALSSGVNQQAEVVQETTAAMTEMSSMLAQTSNYAKQSESVMGAVTQKANNGMTVMNEMVDAMSSVQQANAQLQQMAEIIREIGTKTNVINDIVFKTQLLSFNASIEAARAGSHGRGFAVVAEEVGNLAKMSGTAAQEISALLADSERQVGDIVKNTSERIAVGKNVAEQALKNFKEIATDINLISNQIGNISAAAREQELGVAQTNQAMSELNKTTDLNNQIAGRASATSGVLSSEVQALTEISNSIENSLTGRARSGLSAPAAMVNVPLNLRKPSVAPSPSSEIASSQEPSAGNVADRIVEMAKKQRANKQKKSS